MPKVNWKSALLMASLVVAFAGCPQQEMLQVRPHCLHFTESDATSGDSLGLRVFNGNIISGNPLEFTLIPSADWIILDQTSGTSDNKFDIVTTNVSIAPGFEAEGGFITVQSNAGDDQVDIFVEPDE